MDVTDRTPRHPIRVVAQRTGLTPATIRAWERRYAAVSPERSDGGQRLYSDSDVARLDMLRHLTDAGRPISMVAELSDEDARRLLDEDRISISSPVNVGRGGDAEALVEQAFALCLALDADALERLLWRAALSFDGERFLEGVVAPLLARIGLGWEAGELHPGQEHVASDVVDRVLGRVADRSRADEGPALVVATLPGERHGLGARLVATAAAVEGWDVTFLGTDLPVSSIVSAVSGIGAVAVAISVVSRARTEETRLSLESLRAALPPSVDVLVGGAGAAELDPRLLPGGVVVAQGLAGLRGLRAAHR